MHRDKLFQALRHGASAGCEKRNGLPAWRVAANVLNEQSLTASNGSPTWGLGEVLTILKLKLTFLRIFYNCLRHILIL